MTPAMAKAALARQLRAHGEQISLVRSAGTFPDLWARIMGFDPDELTAGIDQGSRKVILEAEGLAIEPAKGDFLLIRGRKLAILSVDSDTRRLAGEIIAYEIEAKG